MSRDAFTRFATSTTPHHESISEQPRAGKVEGGIISSKTKTCRMAPQKKVKKSISKGAGMKKGDKKLTFIARTVLKQVVQPNNTIGTGAEIA